MAPHPPLVRRCLDLATGTAAALLARAVDRAVTQLQQEEDQAREVARRQELADAWMALLHRRQDWCARYPALLREAMEGGAAASALGTAPAPQAGVQPALALVEEAALARSLEAARLKQLLAPRLEQVLGELDGLMSSALGLEVVQPERNPLRPESFADALGRLMHPPERPDWPALWTRGLALALAEELEQLYRQALQLLRDARLQAASYRLLPAAPSPSPSPSPTASPTASPAGRPAPEPAPGTALSSSWSGGAGAALGGASWADLTQHELGDELFQHFLFARSQPSRQGLAPAYYAHVEQQLAALEAAAGPEPAFDGLAAASQRGLPPVERAQRPVGTATALDGAQWGPWAPARERALVRTRLKKEARQVGQVLGLEVVRKLVDQVGRDPRLLAPVREAVVAVEPALLRLALVEPRFFGEEAHAGRRLVERVAERSFRYNDEFAPDFQSFFGELRTIFRALNEAPVEGAAPFVEALGYLEERWAAVDAAEAAGARAAVETFHFAEAREAEAGRIAWTLSQRADLEGAPAVVQDFLFGPWALVMAHARLTGQPGELDPGGWTSLIGDLLWSVRTEQTLRDPARLFTTVPGMLERLRGGLALLEQDVAEHDTFFQALEKLHRPVLKLRARSRQGAAAALPPVDLDPALLATARRQPAPAAGDPFMARSERQSAGFEDGASGPVPLAAQRAQDEARVAADDSAAELAGLRQGRWVDLHARGEWRRAQLTWVSSRGTLFMFVSGGGRPHSMTRRTLQRLLQARLLRPVAEGAVVERALEALSRQRARPQPLAA